MPIRTTVAAPGLALVGILAFGLVASCGSSAGTSPPASTARTSGSPGSAAPPPRTSDGATAVGSEAPVPVENNPPGDIPDSIAFVTYTNTPGGYSFVHPEGWAETTTDTRVSFVDKLNGIAAESVRRGQPASVADAAAQEVPRLRSTQPAFEQMSVDPVSLPAGSGVKIVYRRNSAPDPVTGRQYRDEVEEYLVTRGAKTVRLDVYGPVGADNVDAYRMITQSLRLS
jgi:hypothetical protein